MVPRYLPQGTMTCASNGNYVAGSDYDKLDETLNQVLDTAANYFKQVEAGEMTAEHAATVIRLCAKLCR